ncbi:hypothetical protein BTO20_37750 (plasmid) [Mycobacterium dioxanotrophicus]|jgi:hypothetical protein|uniref:Uncharacterized protein n=1 Tax=Mycobacterium dioxanotrophicus TaxID=482462 RepID=A0A1Y0CH86_9MYCO|nr:hypothetical protein [Mycobacterium dioxanotrophicus]ART74367.1 hypothetical protein BTO20_37750 [Mycobacterium dioxanotrophicus]
MNVSAGISLADITRVDPQPWVGVQWFLVLIALGVVTALATGGLAVAFTAAYKGSTDSGTGKARSAFTEAAIWLAVGVLACIGWYFILGWALRHAQSWFSATLLTGVFLAAGLAAVWIVRHSAGRTTAGISLTVAVMIVGVIALVVWSADTGDRWNRWRHGWPSLDVPITLHDESVR